MNKRSRLFYKRQPGFVGRVYFSPFSSFFPRSLLALLPSGICHFRSFALPSRAGGMQFGQTDFAEWIVLDLYYQGLRVKRRSPASTVYRHEPTFVVYALTYVPESPQCSSVPHIISIKSISYLFRLVSDSSLETYSDLFIPSPPSLLILLCKVGKILTFA